MDDHHLYGHHDQVNLVKLPKQVGLQIMKWYDWYMED